MVILIQTEINDIGFWRIGENSRKVVKCLGLDSHKSIYAYLWIRPQDGSLPTVNRYVLMFHKPTPLSTPWRCRKIIKRQKENINYGMDKTNTSKKREYQSRK